MARSRIFELRTYVATPGRLDALSARFREHTMRLFAAHGIEVVSFFIARDADDASSGKLVYLCAYADRAAAERAWAAFREDPEWQRARAESEREGSLTTSVESLFMEPTDYSPLE